MHKRIRLAAHLFSVLALTLLVTGCPKRPVVPQVAAPAPVAPAPAPPPPPAPAPAPPPVVAAPPAPTPAPTPPPPQPVAPAPTPMPPPPPADYEPDANLKDVFFDFDKSDIRAADAKTLDAAAAYLKSNSRVVLIEGHCDERGTSEYNIALGERRAKAAMNYLVAQGIDASRVSLVSYGEERPSCTEKAESCWTKNRRDRFLSKPR
jgi:peptidoglycan-associated lipoprotein